MAYGQGKMSNHITYHLGIPEALREDAAQLYDEAFGAKLALAISNREQRLRVLADALCLPFALVAIADERLVGLAGFKTPQGGLTKGLTASKLIHTLGILGGLWAILILSLYERSQKGSALLMDGIAVSQTVRGQGIGTGLLNALKAYAHSNGFSQIRLDVIDTNPAARRLYERQGFVATTTQHFGYLRWLLGFGASTTLIFTLANVE